MKIILAFVFSVLLLSGCVQTPTEDGYTVDLRPAISFIPRDKTQDTTAYTVYVDNLNMGSASQYLDKEAALRLLSGSHLIEVKRNSETVFSTKVYLGDRAIKTFNLP